MNKLNWRRYFHSADANIYYWCLGVTLLWRIGLELVNQTLIPIITPGPGEAASPGSMQAGIHGLSRWVSNWDGSWYATITQHGYVIVDHFKTYESVAFFPFFPYLVKVLSDVTHISYKIVGLGLNLIFTSLIAFFLYKLTSEFAREHDVKKDATKLSKLSVIFLFINPSSFFFAAYYADALLILLTTASIYFGYKNRFILAAVLAGLATATKSIAVVVLPVLLLLYVLHYKNDLLGTIRRRWAELIALCGLSVAGLLVYIAYLGIKFNSPFAFIKTEKYWDRNVSGFFVKNVWVQWYEKLFDPHYYTPASNYLYSLFLMAIPPVIIAVAVYILVKHRLKYAWLAAMALLTLLIPLSTGTLLSLNRYILILTPLLSYLFVYVYTKSARLKTIIIASGYISVVVMIIFAASFLSLRFMG